MVHAHWNDLLANSPPWKACLLHIFDFDLPDSLPLSIAQRTLAANYKTSGKGACQWAYLDGCKVLFFAIGFSLNRKFCEKALAVLEEIAKAIDSTALSNSLGQLNNLLSSPLTIGQNIRKLLNSAEAIMRLKHFTMEILNTLIIPSAFYTLPVRRTADTRFFDSV